jgi:hypothetical protein
MVLDLNWIAMGLDQFEKFLPGIARAATAAPFARSSEWNDRFAGELALEARDSVAMRTPKSHRENTVSIARTKKGENWGFTQ